MQDIRKPYSRSKSNRDISSRVEAFEKHTYQDEPEELYDEEPVHIPVKRSFKERRSIDKMEVFPERGRRAYDNGEPTLGRRGGDDIIIRDPRTKYASKGESIGTIAFVITLLVVLIGGSLLTFVFNHATVTITPKYDDLADYRSPITFALPGSDTENTVLYTLATSTLTRQKSLPAGETKQVQTKASGKVIVYNNYSTEPQRLIKNTRFESSAGKIYRINQSITVPGMSGGKPGSTEVTVYADSVGSDYNSGPTDFTIPGFKGAPQYDKFYARSNGPLTGGASGTVSMPSVSDINAAKDELALELAQEVKDALLKQKMDGYVGLYGATDIVYVDNEAALLAGETTTYEVTATGYLMFAKADELAKAVARSVRDYKGEPVRLEALTKINYTRKDTDRLSTVQSLDILVDGTPRIVFLTNEDELKKLLAGKKRSEFTTLMKSVDSIEGAEISFSPLWLSSFPEDQSKISVVESLPKP